MRCRNPYIAPGGGAHGCGQCLPCRINKKREWAHRLMLEARCHDVSSFWTLTYSDANLPWIGSASNGFPTLVPKHLTDFMKRLRKYHHPLQLRYFNVGEYGDQYGRPHYHLALFNFPACDRGVTDLNRRGDCCPLCDTVRDIWAKGQVFSGQLEDASAAYICGYVTKKLTTEEDIRWANAAGKRNRGKGEWNQETADTAYPEFARMSLKPGIGAMFMPEVASVLLSHNLDISLPDVPTSLQVGTRVRPLGRYLTRELRKHVGMEPNAPKATLEAQKARLQDLRQTAKEVAPKGLFSETFRSLIISAHQGHYDRTVFHSKLKKKRGSL